TKLIVEIKSDLIEAEKDILMPVEANQVIEIEEVVEEEIDFDEMHGADLEEVPEKSFIKRIMKDPKKKRIAMVLGVLFLFALLIGEEEKSIDDSQDSKAVVVTEKPEETEAQKAE